MTNGRTGRLLSRPARLWADQPLTVKGLVVVGLPLAILLAALFCLYLASRSEARAEAEVRAAFAIQSDIHEVHALLAEAASGVRGYLLTGQARFLEPYVKAEAELPGAFSRLDSEIHDSEVRRRFETVRTLAERKRNGLAALRQVPGAGTPAALERPEVLAALVANKAVLDALRSEIEAMQARESALLSARRARADAVRASNLRLTVISGVLGLLGGVAAVSLLSTGIVRRIRLLEDNAGRLERGERLHPLPLEADEIGRLAVKLDEASNLLQQREHALGEATEAAVAASQAKSEFLSRTSHELRTPLSAILGFAQLLELDDAELKPPQATAVQQILKAGRHLLALIDEVLDISSIEAGRMGLSQEPMDLRAALTEALDLSSPIAEAAGVRLEHSLPSTPVIARADRRRVVQVALNLISNAIKYNRPNGTAHMALTVAAGRARVEVTDDGQGIAEAAALRLFTPFDRLGRERTRGVEGIGLGLALSKRLVEAMDGRIGFENRAPAQGARFWFDLPVQTDDRRTRKPL